MLIAGATAVCIVCYVIPVALHLKLHFSKCGYQLLEAAESPHLAEPLLQVGVDAVRLCCKDLSFCSYAIDSMHIVMTMTGFNHHVNIAVCFQGDPLLKLLLVAVQCKITQHVLAPNGDCIAVQIQLYQATYSAGAGV